MFRHLATLVIALFFVVILNYFCLEAQESANGSSTENQWIVESKAPRLLLISSAITDAGILGNAVNNETIAVHYDVKTATLSSLLKDVKRALNDRKASSIAIAAHDCGTAQFFLSQSAIISLHSTLSNHEEQQFWSGLGSLLTPGGRIDLLSCNLASEVEGKMLVSSISEAAGVPVAASTDPTGHLSAGGNWILETRSIDAQNLYFDSERLAEFSGLLATQIKKLYPVDHWVSDAYGHAVDIYLDIAIVGAPYDDEMGQNAGAAYIFYRDEGGTDNWGLKKKLLPIGTGADLVLFGYSVSINDTYAIVGVPWDTDDNSKQGSVYVFAKDWPTNPDSWQFVTRIFQPAGQEDDNFGWSVDLDDETIIVGAPGEDSGGTNAGGAYILKRNPTTNGWPFVTRISASDRSDHDQFGKKVTISGYQAAAAAPQTYGSGRGAVYTYSLNLVSGDWIFRKKLTSPTPSDEDYFGNDIHLYASELVVGCKGDDSAAENAGAVFIFDRNEGGSHNWGQVKKITALDAAADDYYGSSVAMMNTYLVVGAPRSDTTGKFYVYGRNTGGADNWGEIERKSPPDGQSGDYFGRDVGVTGTGNAVIGAHQKNDYGDHSGAAYIFNNNKGGSNEWGMVQRLISYEADGNDRYGRAVSISGNYAVIGAPNHDGNGTNSGAAFVYYRDQGGENNWGQIAILKASDGSAYDYFGYSVSISSHDIVIGAYGDDDNGSSSGSAYIFKRNYPNTGLVGQLKKLTASDAAAYDNFGKSVCMAGSSVVVGAAGNDDGGTNAGSAYLFKRFEGGTNNWGEVNKIVAPDPAAYDNFGYDVALQGGYILISATGDDVYGNSSGSAYIFSGVISSPLEFSRKLIPDDGSSYDYFGRSVDLKSDKAIVGASGDDDNGSSSGSAYIFERNYGGSSNWGQVKKLLPNDGAAQDLFGYSVAIYFNAAVVGAYGNDDSGSLSGSAYVFVEDHKGEKQWGQFAKLTASDAQTYDRFGFSTALSGQIAVIGAYGDDDVADGVGSAYIFEQPFVSVPRALSVTPDSGNDSVQTFTAVYDDSNYADDLRYCYFKIADFNNAIANCVYLRYRRATNKLDLRTDSGGSWKGGYVLGSANTLQNSNVSINIAAASSAKDGTRLTLTLPLIFKRNFAGTHNIYMQAYDMGYADSGISNMGTFTVNAVPKNVNVTPDSGSSGAQTFNAQYSDNNGAADLRYLYFKIGNSSNGTANCAYFRYRPVSNKLDLRSDSGGSWLGGYVIGSSNTLENSQVRVDVSAITVDGLIYTLILNLPLEFKAGFAGDKRIYMNATDMLYDSPGWEQMGTFTVTETAYAPTNQSLSPTSGTGGWKTFDATYRDLNGADDIRYAYFKVADAAGATANCVYIRYRNATNRLDLRTNAGGSWIAGGDIGAVATLQNGQVSINMEHVTETISGNDLTLRLPLVFKAAFNGAHNLYMYSSDAGGLNSGWDNMGTFTVNAATPAPGEAQTLSLSSEIARGTRIHFNDHIQGMSDAVWFVNDERLRSKEPSYRFTRSGLYQIGVTAGSSVDETIFGGDEILVGEKLLRAADLVSWNGEAVPIRLSGKQTIGVKLADSRAEGTQIIRLTAIFTPGVRIVFDYRNARNYSFVEMREGATPEEWQWVLGRSSNGKEIIRASASVKPSDKSRMLALRLASDERKTGIFLDRKPLFKVKISSYSGGSVLLQHTGIPGIVDICISKLKK